MNTKRLAHMSENQSSPEGAGARHRLSTLPVAGRWAFPSRGAALALDRLSHGVVITDGAGRVVYVNPSAEQIIGRSAAQMLRRSLVETLVRAGYALRCDEEDQSRSLRKGEFTVQLESRSADHRSVEIRAVPLSERGDTLSGELYEIRDVSESLQRTRQLIYEATHDPLTGLANRRALTERLGQSLQWEPEPHAETVLALLDLDGFKRVNDECGHLAGDQVLRDIALILQDNTRKADMPVRLGGDEFVVLLVGCGVAEAQRIIETIRHDIEAYRYRAADMQYQVTASIGVVVLDSGVSEVSQALQQADQACYGAKNAGGNRLCIDPSDTRRAAAGSKKNPGGRMRDRGGALADHAKFHAV